MSSPPTTTPIRKVLIANRGEIAVRVARTCRRLGIATATVHSSADRFGRHVREIGESIELGTAAASESYLRIDAVIAAARSVGADAVHPGYGFLSENADAARAVEAAGLTWIGPTPETIDAFGDKAKAKVLAVAAGVPVIPGVEGTFTDTAEIDAAVRLIGTPALLKAAAGGGGRGMRQVDTLDDLEPTIEMAMSEARRSFGSPDLMVERYLVDARHIEVQIAGDGEGNVIHLLERECSLQRRHQKIIEEAPAPTLSDDLRQRIHEAACALGRHVSYRSIGTVELIVTGDEFFFLEVNPRIQVEHPVTEEITGIDLVELQLRIATGGGLDLTQDELRSHGHAFEARVYAEDAAQGFLPVVGRIDDLRLPIADQAVGDGGGAVRVEQSVDAGDEVSPHYDPMILKLITSAPDRGRALAALRGALDECHVDGLVTNVDFLRSLAAAPEVERAQFDTRFVESKPPADRPDVDVELVAVGAALWLRSVRRTPPAASAERADAWSAWESTRGWRLGVGEPRATNAPVAVIAVGDDEWPLRTYPADDSGSSRLVIGEADLAVSLRDIDDQRCVAAVGSRSVTVGYRLNANGISVVASGIALPLEIRSFLAQTAASAGASSRNLVAPMTGQVLRIAVDVGDVVEEGQLVVVMESMKLELQIVAQHAGVVAAIHVSPGAIVERNAVVAEIGPTGEHHADQA